MVTFFFDDGATLFKVLFMVLGPPNHSEFAPTSHRAGVSQTWLERALGGKKRDLEECLEVRPASARLQPDRRGGVGSKNNF